MTGTYIHADGTACHHGTDPASLDAYDAWLDDTGHDPDTTPGPQIRCAAGQRLAGFRLDPGTPVPP